MLVIVRDDRFDAEGERALPSKVHPARLIPVLIRVRVSSLEGFVFECLCPVWGEGKTRLIMLMMWVCSFFPLLAMQRQIMVKDG